VTQNILVVHNEFKPLQQSRVKTRREKGNRYRMMPLNVERLRIMTPQREVCVRCIESRIPKSGRERTSFKRIVHGETEEEITEEFTASTNNITTRVS
jgi:hypothetical protein